MILLVSMVVLFRQGKDVTVPQNYSVVSRLHSVVNVCCRLYSRIFLYLNTEFTRNQININSKK